MANSDERLYEARRRKEALKRYKLPRGEWRQIDLATNPNTPHWMDRAYVNNRYTIMIDDGVIMSNGVSASLCMVQRLDNTRIPNHWIEMQRIKNEIYGEHATGIEYYPAVDHLIDDKNIYWLFVFPDWEIPKYDFRRYSGQQDKKPTQ